MASLQLFFSFYRRLAFYLPPYRRRHDKLVMLAKRLEPQINRQVAPLGIILFDQVDLPVAVPAFQLFFARNGEGHVTEHLEPDEVMNLIVSLSHRARLLVAGAAAA